MTDTADIVVCTACGTLNRVAASKSLAQAKCGKCGSALAGPEPVDLTAARFATLRQRDQRPFVLDVWAPWCGPCRMMAPAYQEAAARLAGKVRFFKLNSEDHPEPAAQLGVRGIPALFLLRGGRILDQRAGALPATEIEAFARQGL